MTHQARRWKFDQPLSQTGLTGLWRCSDDSSQKTGGYVAKTYHGNADSEEFGYFERQAAVSSLVRHSGLLPLVSSGLEEATPILVYPEAAALPLDEWLKHQPQVTTLPTLLRIARQLLQALEALHAQGFTHGNVRPEHILIDSQQHVMLVGLGGCEPVGQITCLPRWPTPFDAPEVRDGDFEASSSADIYSAAVVITQLVGSNFQNSKLANWILADDPGNRLTAGELVSLFLELEFQLHGCPRAPLAA